MYVCHCEVVTDRTIRAAVAVGARDARAVGDACGAGTRCGGCVPAIEGLIAEADLALRDPVALATLQQLRRGLSRRLSEPRSATA